MPGSRLVTRSGFSVALLLVAGCGRPHGEDEWNLSATDRLSPTAQDIGLAQGQLPESGAKVLDAQPSQARFPCAVGVARISVVEDDDGRCVTMQEIDQATAGRWNHLLDAVPQVREVMPMGSYGLADRVASMADVLNQARRLGCGLCIIFATGGDPRHACDAAAVLWDTTTGRPLTSYRTSAVVELDESHRCTVAEGSDHRLCQAEYVALSELERRVRESMWDLVAADTPSGTTQPNPWESHQPRQQQTLLLGGRQIIIRSD